MLFERIAIIGVGLIGGSVGFAAKKRGVARHIVGIDRDSGVLARAAELGAIDSWSCDLSEGVRSAELCVVCTPVDRIAEIILQSASHSSPGLFVTDVGSTKANIVAGVEGRLPAGVEYVPAHPLAGSEKSGAFNGQVDLFLNKTTIVTPMRENSSSGVERVVQFWRALGANVTIMDPFDHDRVLAVTSHLPHAIAATVAGSTPLDFLRLSAGGFRDVTRIAASDPAMWTAILQANREAVLSALTRFNQRLREFQRLLEAGDGAGLERWLTEAKQVRDALGC